MIPPVTAVGSRAWPLVASPSWPHVLSPQQYASPAAVRPQLWSKPSVNNLNLRPPETATGNAVSAVVPLPNCPEPLLPQQYAVLSAASAHTWRVPALIAKKRRPPPTGMGTWLHGSGPPEVTQVWVGRLPSSPSRPQPQQYALESAATIPQVNVPPPVTWRNDKLRSGRSGSAPSSKHCPQLRPHTSAPRRHWGRRTSANYQLAWHTAGPWSIRPRFRRPGSSPSNRRGALWSRHTCGGNRQIER